MAYKEDMMITKKKQRIMIYSVFILLSCSGNFFCVLNSLFLHMIKIDGACLSVASLVFTVLI